MLIIYVLLIIIILLYFFIKLRTIKSVIEYILIWLLIIMLFSPLVIYYADLYDIPTKIGLMKNIDTNRWFDFSSTYVSTIIGTLVSSLIVIITVIKQIEVQNDSSKEDKRIANSPLMKFYIKNDYEKEAKQEFIFNSEGKVYNIFLGIENIGLNHAKKIEIELYCKDDEWERSFKIENEQSILKKDEIYWFDFVINNNKKSKKDKDLNISISYYDMLNNKYEQKIYLKYSVSDELRVESRGLKIYFNKIEIEDEAILK